MASENSIHQLTNIADQIRSIETTKLTRPNLGDESLEEILAPKLNELDNRLSYSIQYAPKLHDDQVNQIFNIFQDICTHMTNFANLSSNAEYINQRDYFINNFNSSLEQLKLYWPPIVTSAIEQRRLIEDEGLKQYYEETVADMRETSSELLETIRQESSEAISEAKKLAEEIERKARRTASRISVEDAQIQFRDAQQELDTQVKTWTIISSVSLTAFFALATYFSTLDVPTNIGSSIIYFTTIRVAMLGALAASSTFALRVLRAHLHMRQKNLHRQRVANSIAAFVESAVTPEQRDLILSHLVESVSSFGPSGLIESRKDRVNPSRLAIDSITRMIKPAESK